MSDDIPDDEVRHRCGGAAKQLRVLQEKVEEVDGELATEIEDLATKIGCLELRLTEGDEVCEQAEAVPDGGDAPWEVVE